uniref:Sulfotransferase n=1 Tax=Entamoeba histolytica TaxID=5759 RepID=S0AV72_ENTHI|nr:hypothetical protein, conserved [Entamoeba histolytica]
MSSQEYALHGFTYPRSLELDSSNPYLQPELPEPIFDQIWENMKKAAVDNLSKYDPSHKELYESMLKEGDSLFDPQFKPAMRDYFAGCFDMKSPMFQQMARNVTGKLMTYMRFSTERKMYRKELDKIVIKNPIFITSLPRSGSTYLHNLIVNDPRASGIRFYEHICPGSKTMESESRKNVLRDMLKLFESSHTEMNTVHNLDSFMNYEEELFFMEMLGQCFIISSAIPRLEQFRVNQFKRDYHYVYETLIDEFKMHLEEFPLKGEDGFLCLKAVNHFATMVPMLDVLGKDEYNARFIWIHREPVEQLKSFIPLLIATKGRFEYDLGKDDIEWLNKFAVKINEIVLKNSIAARDAWVAQDPSRAKRIFDVGFVEAVTKPKETVQKIYDYFGIEMTPEAEKQLEFIIKEGDPQRKHGRKLHDDKLYFFNDEDIRKKYQFYYDRFGQYMPYYYGKK